MIEVIEPQVADPTTSIVSELALCAARVHHLLARIDSTSRHIQTVGPSVTDRLKYEYKDARTVLDQRLLPLDRRPPMDEVFAGETFGRYSKDWICRVRSQLSGPIKTCRGIAFATSPGGSGGRWRAARMARAANTGSTTSTAASPASAAGRATAPATAITAHSAHTDTPEN